MARRILGLIVAALGLVSASPPAATLDDLWAGKAHFEEVRQLDWSRMAGGSPREMSGWFAIQHGAWYVFNRSPVVPKTPGCPSANWRTVVRVSRDQGASWSAAVEAIAPGASGKGDGCAVLDGATTFDASTRTWHILAQCMDTRNAGGWELCHYTRRGRTPMGRFVADPANPVVRPGMLWRPLCARSPGVCDPAGTHDEGTPDIVGRIGGDYLVTFHGYQPEGGIGVRGIAATPDFRRWRTDGPGLPGRPILSKAECGWLPGCVGVGEADHVADDRFDYLVFEAMNRNLGCTPNQRWTFSAVRAPLGSWPTTGSGDWQSIPSPPLIVASGATAGLACSIQYARWFRSGRAVWLVYDERRPIGVPWVHHLLRLMPGGGPARLELLGPPALQPAR